MECLVYKSMKQFDFNVSKQANKKGIYKVDSTMKENEKKKQQENYTTVQDRR